MLDPHNQVMPRMESAYNFLAVVTSLRLPSTIKKIASRKLTIIQRYGKGIDSIFYNKMGLRVTSCELRDTSSMFFLIFWLSNDEIIMQKSYRYRDGSIF